MASPVFKMEIPPYIKKNKKILKKLFFFALLTILFILSARGGLDRLFNKTPLQALDGRGNSYFEETMERAVYTFAIVRGMNGLISVIQGTRVAVSPAGLGVNLAVGEVLDPVNDFAERFSWVMLVSITSLGIQKLLMEIGLWLGFKYLLSGAFLLMMIGLWIPLSTRINLFSLGLRLIWISVFIRFCMPTAALVSDSVYDIFLKDKFTRSVQSLEEMKKEIGDEEVYEARTQDSGIMAAIDRMLKETRKLLKLKEKLAALKDRISDYAEYIIDLIVVFMLQTVVIPISVLWILGKLLRISVEWQGRLLSAPPAQRDGSATAVAMT